MIQEIPTVGRDAFAFYTKERRLVVVPIEELGEELLTRLHTHMAAMYAHTPHVCGSCGGAVADDDVRDFPVTKAQFLALRKLDAQWDKLNTAQGLVMLLGILTKEQYDLYIQTAVDKKKLTFRITDE